MSGGRILVSFSGGKTSGMLSHKIQNAFGTTCDVRHVFANTGLENEATLEFVRECDTAFGLGVVWLEAVINPMHGIGVTHRVVSFESASRNGGPFEAFVRKSGIPNMNKPQCSDRLKALVIEDYKKTVGWRGVAHAIGIRIDEPSRRSKSAAKYNLCYPLLDWPDFVADKSDVTDFWDEQPFTLRLEPHEGNCETCWKKSDKKLWLLAKEHPDRFEFMARMEAEYGHVKPNDGGVARTFFRRNRRAVDILREARDMDASVLRKMIGADVDESDGCSESCEAYEHVPLPEASL